MFIRNHQNQTDEVETFLQNHRFEFIQFTAELLAGELKVGTVDFRLHDLGRLMATGSGTVVHFLIDELRRRFRPDHLPASLAAGCLLLCVHKLLLDAAIRGEFCPRCEVDDALVASGLLLHQPATWSAAFRLVAILYEGDHAADQNGPALYDEIGAAATLARLRMLRKLLANSGR